MPASWVPPALLASDIEEVRAVFETNYFGARRVAKAFAPVLADNGGGALADIVRCWPGWAAWRLRRLQGGHLR